MDKTLNGIIFDWGNVLGQFSHDEMRKKLAEHCPLTTEDVKRVLAGPMQKHESGALSLRASFTPRCADNCNLHCLTKSFSPYGAPASSATIRQSRMFCASWTSRCLSASSPTPTRSIGRQSADCRWCSGSLRNNASCARTTRKFGRASPTRRSSVRRSAVSASRPYRRIKCCSSTTLPRTAMPSERWAGGHISIISTPTPSRRSPPNCGVSARCNSPSGLSPKGEVFY